jgi:hypothetical protein
MSRPYTVYPDPADNPYMIGVPCPYCGAGEAERCRTSGGNVYGELCHKKRKAAAQTQGVELRLMKPERPVETDPPVDTSVPSKVQALKIAFWYIDTLGGVERAKAYFDAAAKALNTLPEED